MRIDFSINTVYEIVTNFNMQNNCKEIKIRCAREQAHSFVFRFAQETR